MTTNGHTAAPRRAVCRATTVSLMKRSTAIEAPAPSVMHRARKTVVINRRKKRGQGALCATADAMVPTERGEAHTASELLPLVYNELRTLAARKLAHEKPGQTLDATGLVHEAYLRLAKDTANANGTSGGAGWSNQRHFFAAVAEAMRRILVENARRKRREKHGGGRHREHADLDALCAGGFPQDILALHAALEQFAVREPLKAKLVELRFFGGLTLEQAASCLEISLSTADRAWRYSRAWLYAAMADSGTAEKNSA
jgi:RNA polymerase sigma factor (TIGR02999 family)